MSSPGRGITDAELLEAWRPLLEARSAELAQRRTQPKPKTAAQREEDRMRELELRADLEKLEKLPRGPNLEPHERHTASTFVQEHDLEDLIPDGWGRQFHANAERIGRRAKVGGCAVLILSLMKWVHGLAQRSGRWTLTGVGAQLSPSWIARKLAFDERTVERAMNKLDPFAPWRRELREWKRQNEKRKARRLDPLPRPPRPTGTAYLHRYDRRRVFAKLVRNRPAHQRTDRWMDAAGTLRTWVDLTGVVYVTDEGIRLLRRRKHAKQPRRGEVPELLPNLADEDLHKRLKPLVRTLRNRLAPAVQGHAAPNNVTPVDSKYFRGSTEQQSRRARGPGPPRGELWSRAGPSGRALEGNSA